MRLAERSELKPAGQLREYFGEALLEVCRGNPKVVVLDGDLGNSTKTHLVRKEFPDRFFNIGIAESNLVGVGAGLASCGYVPFIASFPSFLLCNAYDQIRLSVSIPGLNVKLVGSHAGLTTGREGPPPMSIEDFALVGALPPFVILVPCDPASMREAVHAAARHEGPVYLRSSREAMPHIYREDDCPFRIGRANVLRQGGDVTIVACGLMVARALDAAGGLAEEGIEARVLDMHTVKPLDEKAITAAARQTGAIVTAEEHLVRGGMGAGVARVAAATHPVPMRFVGLRDTYAESGSLQDLTEKYGLTSRHVVAAAREAVRAKGR